jgi:hypothetical protein
LAKPQKSGFIERMKTTLEVPDDLHREVKSRAALRRRKIKDYVAEGLRLALDADASRDGKSFDPYLFLTKFAQNRYIRRRRCTL